MRRERWSSLLWAAALISAYHDGASCRWAPCINVMQDTSAIGLPLEEDKAVPAMRLS